MGPEFFQTQMGQLFYQKTMPEISQQLTKLNTNLEMLIELFRQGLEADKEIQEKRVRIIEE